MAGEEHAISSHVCVLVEWPPFTILNKKDCGSSYNLLELLLGSWGLVILIILI